MVTSLALYLLALVAGLFTGRLFANGLGIATGGLGRWSAARSGRTAPADQGVVPKLGTLFPASLTTTAAMLSVALAGPSSAAGPGLAPAVVAGGAALATTVVLPVAAVLLARARRARVAAGTDASPPSEGSDPPGLTEGERRGPLGDVVFFLVAFGAAVLAGALGASRVVDAVLAVVLVAAFVRRALRRLPSLPTPPSEERLLLLPGRVVSGWVGLGQALLALVLLAGCAELAVRSVEDLASRSGRSVAVVGLLLLPAFTDLLGKEVTLRWVRRGRVVQGLSFTTSALAFTAGVVTPVVMLLGAWDLGPATTTAAVAALVGAAVLAAALARRGAGLGRWLALNALLAVLLAGFLLSGASS